MESRDFQKAAGILAIGLILSTAIGGVVVFKSKTLGNVIEVTGSAEKLVTSDVVKWSGRISRSVGMDGLKSGNEGIKSDLARALVIVKAAGVKDEEINIRTVSVYPTYNNDSNGQSHQTGYSLDQTFTVESHDVQGITKTSKEVADKMLNEGIVFQTDALEYYYSKLADLKLDLISEATANAKERAQRIADSTDANLGTVRSAGLGVFQVTAVNSTEISDYGSYDTSALEKKVTAIARASFQLR